jgi:HNH endonuclease
MIMMPVYSEDTAPIAYAGSLNDSQTVTSGDIIALDASKSYDPDGDNLNYYWYQIAGQNVTLSAIRIVNPTFTAPNVTIPTTLKFGLLVDDGKIVSQPSIISITVQPTNNIQPGITGDKQTTSPSLKSSQPEAQQRANDYSGLKIAFILVLLLGTVAWIRRKYRSGKHRIRRYFSESIKKQTLGYQNYKCAICKKSAGGVWDYDHIDGNRSNNSPDNCQVLCPNCHAKKSRGLLKQEAKSHFLRWLVSGILLFFVILILIAIANYGSR